MSEWNQFEWAEDAKRLLDWEMISSEHPLMLVLRHSHREERNTVEEIRKLRLTPIGKQGAYLFGKSLAAKNHVEVYYSTHPRCVETAEEIVRGYNSAHGGAELTSDIRVLLGPPKM